MSARPAQHQPIAGFAIELNQRLMAVRGLSGIREILDAYVEYFDVWGAVLWEFVEKVGGSAKGRLVIQAQSLRKMHQPPFYHLEMDSISGTCIQENRPALHSRQGDRWNSDISVSYPDVLDRLGIQSFVSVPIRLRWEARRAADAALTFYRRERQFTEEDFAELQQAALLFPAAYRSVQERASLILIKDVHAILRANHYSSPKSADSAAGDGQQSSAKPGKLGDSQEHVSMHKVLDKIAKHFQFVEATVYLHNPLTDPPGRFSRIAEIWPWTAESKSYYEAGDGGTGWVLETGRPLLLLDLALYETDRDYYRRKYEGMEWRDRTGIEWEVRRLFGLSEKELCPLSYVCVPILHNNTVTGALRCCISRNGPYHVDEDIAEVISAAADMIADWWDHWIQVQQESEARQSALSIMSSLGTLAHYAVEHLRGPAGLGKIVARILELCRIAVPQADIVELWLRQSGNTETLELMEANLEPASPGRKVSLEETTGKKRNAFRYALRTPDVLHVDQVVHSAFAAPEGTAISFTVAPVLAEGASGVLYLAATESVAWPPTISIAARSLADQLALYLTFHFQARKEEAANARIKKSADEQAALFLDFQHQLRTPINIARNSLERLKRYYDNTEWNRSFEALNASTRRAGTVANNLDFFISLAGGKPVAARMERLSSEKVLDWIEQASSFIYNKGALGRTVAFKIRNQYPFPLPFFAGDRNLIELAIDNLLDNAVKYSYAGTDIGIEAGPALYGREVYFSFRNKGLPIEAAEIPCLTERGFRGEKAKVSSPEGSGIGLWAVAIIMRAMSGRLEIKPTTEDGWNEFRLCFKGYLP
jgi:signal transduction histidine kinase